jgi:MIP family channel proteins
MDDGPRHQAPLPRKIAVEFVGTFFLTTIAAGIDVVAALSEHEVSRASRAVAPALVVAALIYALGDISGAHFNPVVSFAFVLRRVFPVGKMVLYWSAQLAGAVCAALVLRGLFGTVAHIGANRLELTASKGFAVEVLVTGLLVTVIVNVSSKHSLIGPDAALPVGATIALCGLFAGTLTGPSMNPARSLGPALVGAHYQSIWVFVAGPFTGGVAAVALSYALHPGRSADEEQAAQGEGG